MPDIGVVLDSFGQPVKDALHSASRLGFRQVEMPATSEEVEPGRLSRTGRRDLLHYVGDMGLRLSALGGDLGGARFGDSSALEQRLEKTRAILEMARDLRVPLVTTHLGRVSEEALTKGHLGEAVRYLAEAADRTGTLLALETGGGAPGLIARVLRDVNCPLLGACYDPASLLIEGYSPLSGVEPLADRILIARVRDALAGSSDRPGRETRLGEGELDLAEYVAALDQAGYHNTAFVRRVRSERPFEDLADARARLESLLR